MDWSLLGVLKLGAALVVGLPLFAYLLQDKLIFLPQAISDSQHQAIAARHREVADVFLQVVDGPRLHAWHVKGLAGAPLVLYFGGNAEEVSWLLDELPRHASGVAWLLVDYRGYGSSGGAPSEQALHADALAWYDRYSRESARIYAFGRSLGSGVAVRLAAERRVDRVVLVTPFDSMVAVGRHHYPFLPVDLLLKHRFDSLSFAPKITVPLLCIVATDDAIIPPQHAQRLYDAWGGPKRWLAVSTDHNDIHNHPEYWPNIREFLAGR